MFCSRCGTEIEKVTQFCPSCGLDLRLTTPTQAIATGDVTELDIVCEALRDEYELLEELGRGGMAIVYRAMDKQLEREVALKVLPFSLAFDAEFVERFQREARTAAQLEHPNIIPIHRVGKSGRVIYFSMKLLRGGSLSRLLYDRHRIAPAELRKLLADTGSALGYAARRGIVHRDIKPDNIMFDEHGVCVVTDFGIAKAGSAHRLTGTGMSIGTPHYMSPEQARAQAIDGRSDIYSLGIVGYQCLVGEVPYDGEDSFAIGYKHIMEPIPSPSLAGAEERRLFEVIKKMIMKDPADRFQDSEELIAALEGHPFTQANPRRISVAQLGLASQPTSPVPVEEIEEMIAGQAGVVGVPGAARRSVVRRSVAQSDQTKNSYAWLWGILLLVLAGGSGAFFYLRSRAHSQPGGVALKPDTSASVPAPQTVADSTQAYLDTALSSDHPLVPRDSVRPIAAAARPATTDSGSLRLIGLPKGSQVMVDSKAVTDPNIKLSAGPHELAISAPHYNFYLDTVTIAANRELSLTPNLGAIGSVPDTASRLTPTNCDVPSVGNRFGRACYDTPPLPIGPVRVPLTSSVQGNPSPAVLLVKVSATGETVVVQTHTSSNDPAFEGLAQVFARELTWHPATRKGVPVEGWTQFAFLPADR
jgi:serine/threonine-protein kinase